MSRVQGQRGQPTGESARMVRQAGESEAIPRPKPSGLGLARDRASELQAAGPRLPGPGLEGHHHHGLDP